MNEETPLMFLVLVCGLPGTLKTFLSARIAHRLGAIWLPTVSLARITTDPGIDLDQRRMSRYEQCFDVLNLTATIGARVVVEGGFSSTELKRRVFAKYPKKCPRILIECAASTESRLARLRLRAQDSNDPEQASAESIINHLSTDAAQDASAILSTPDPEELGCSAVFSVDTTRFSLSVSGSVGPRLEEQISLAIQSSFDEYRVTNKLHARALLAPSFDDLAPLYDETTEWRTAPVLLEQIRIQLPRCASDVVDIGSGTGLASEWYTEQGHRCVGVDISPHMSTRAASRVLFTNFGSATDLPFFDESFDLAIIRQVLHYTEPTLAIREARRVLRADGRLIIASAVVPSDDAKSIWEEFKNITQPLRLRVFSQEDLLGLVSSEGFNVTDVRQASLTRRETFDQITQRAREPRDGWLTFMQRMEKAFASLMPSLEFRVTGTDFSYRQFWITLVAEKSAPRR